MSRVPTVRKRYSSGPAGIGLGAAHRFDIGAEHLLAVGADPLVQCGERRRRSLEMRHYMAGEQLVAPPGLLAGCLSWARNMAAEPVLAQFNEPLDALGHGVGRADQGGAGVHPSPIGSCDNPGSRPRVSSNFKPRWGGRPPVASSRSIALAFSRTLSYVSGLVSIERQT
jgi:hypothetical protein